MVDNFMSNDSISAINSNCNNTSTSSNEITNATATMPSKQTYTVADMPSLFQGLHNPDIKTQIISLRGFRKLLSVERCVPVKDCIECGVVPIFVQCLQRLDCPELIFEAAWALTNIASSDHTRLVVECGAIPYLSQLLMSENPDIREQCAWCLGNVAGDGPELRNAVLNHDALKALVINVAQPANTSLLRNCTWALSNFCRGKPQPPLNVLLPAIPVLANVIQQNTDQETSIDASWALSYISDGDDSRIQAVVDQAGVISSLINMLASGKASAIVPSLRCIGNIVSGSDKQTQAVIDHSALPVLACLLSNQKKNIRKETCWALSNIAAGSVEQINQLMNVPDLIVQVLTQVSTGAEWDVRKEAAWVISNIASGGSKANIIALVEYGAIRPICELLDVNDVKITLLAMESLACILKHNIDNNERIIQLIDEAEGIDKIEELQKHENIEIYNKSIKLIETYFNEEEETENENIAPAYSSQGNNYSFGFPATTGKASVDFSSSNPFMQQSQEKFNSFNF